MLFIKVVLGSRRLGVDHLYHPLDLVLTLRMRASNCQLSFCSSVEFSFFGSAFSTCTTETCLFILTGRLGAAMWIVDDPRNDVTSHFRLKDRQSLTCPTLTVESCCREFVQETRCLFPNCWSHFPEDMKVSWKLFLVDLLLLASWK